MNRQANAFRRIQTDRPLEEVMRAVKDALQRLGGFVDQVDHTIKVREGNAGSMGFMATADAHVLVKPGPNSTYEIRCDITVRPNALFWVCAIAGLFCLWPLWIVNFLYFVNDPITPYQRALDQVEFFPPIDKPQ